MENERGRESRTGLLLVLSGPSGAGKSTVASGLLARDAGIERGVSVTTRPPRPAEIDGRDYHFVTEARFEQRSRGGEFLEASRIYGHRYGTPRTSVEESLSRGKDVLLILDAVGRAQLVRLYGPVVLTVFLLPPDQAELERRLRSRGDGCDFAARLESAEGELARCRDCDLILPNADLERTVSLLAALLSGIRSS